MTLFVLLACTDYTVDFTGDDGKPGLVDTAGTGGGGGGGGGDTGDGEPCNGVDDDGDGAVDEGWPDSDGDGVADCVDEPQDTACPDLADAPAQTVATDTACSAAAHPVPDAFAARVLWSVRSPSADATLNSSGSPPLVVNLDDDNGDGVVDGDDDPEVVIVMFDSLNYLSGAVVEFDGATGADGWLVSGVAGIGTPSVGDVDGDGAPNVIVAADNGTVLALSPDGSVLWQSTAVVDNPYTPVTTVSDLDSDGHAEVLAGNLILDGETGALRTELPASSGTTSPVPVDLDDDGLLEVVYGNAVYDLDGTERWGTGLYQIQWSAVVQADDDPAPEIGFLGQAWELYDDDGTLLASRDLTGGVWPAPPCAGDFDGDGQMELARPNGKALVMMELDGTDVWATGASDMSGETSCSAYDLDADGIVDVLYGDETSVAFYKGDTGEKLWEYSDQISGTIFEYPTIADVDHDDHAEILFVSSWQPAPDPTLTVLEHDGWGWPRSGPVWGTHDFSGKNVSPDGSIPAAADPAWRTSGLFRGRPVQDDDRAPDLGVAIVDVCVADCDAGPVEVEVQLQNTGARDMPAGVPLTLYADGVAVATTTLPALPAGEAPAGIVLSLGVEGIAHTGWAAVIDDIGTGEDIVAECDETDNRDEWSDGVCP